MQLGDGRRLEPAFKQIQGLGRGDPVSDPSRRKARAGGPAPGLAGAPSGYGSDSLAPGRRLRLLTHPAGTPEFSSNLQCNVPLSCHSESAMANDGRMGSRPGTVTVTVTVTVTLTWNHASDRDLEPGRTRP